MKTLSILLFFLCASLVAAQTVPSSCDAPDSVKEKYQEDAAWLALHYSLKIDSTFSDTVRIDQTLQYSFLNALLAVYNASDLQAKDTVTIINNVHHHDGYFLDGVYVYADTTSEWMKNLMIYILPSGNKSLDSILSMYSMSIDTVSYRSAKAEIRFISDGYINTKALSGAINTVLYSGSAYPGVSRAQGHWILGNKADSIITLTYALGFVQCPPDCMMRRYWQFTILPDCSVRFDSSYGDLLPVSSVHEEGQRFISLYPNPVTDKLIIETEERGTAIISNVNGKEVQTATLTEGKNEIVVSELPSGMYFITLRDRSGNITMGRFIKM